MTTNSTIRKQNHLEFCATQEVSFKNKSTLFEDMELIHQAIPELAFDEISTCSTLGSNHLAAPFWISAITGGTGEKININKELAQIANELKIGFCLGSIRPFLKDKKWKDEFFVRDVAPDSLVMANIGAIQIAQYGFEPILDAMKTLKVDGITVHLNSIMELIQQGGDRDFRGILNGIDSLIKNAGNYIIVVKETGCGLSFGDGQKLKKINVRYVETAGAGGTSFIGVETLRAKNKMKKLGAQMWDWGIPTAASTAWMVDLGFNVISSGGIYTSLDMAKALTMGANITGIARPIVQIYHQKGSHGVKEYLETLIEGLKFIMMGCGIKTISEFKHIPHVIGKTLSQYIEIAKDTETVGKRDE